MYLLKKSGLEIAVGHFKNTRYFYLQDFRLDL